MWLSQDYPMIYKNYPIILDNSTFTIGLPCVTTEAHNLGKKHVQNRATIAAMLGFGPCRAQIWVTLLRVDSLPARGMKGI